MSRYTITKDNKHGIYEVIDNSLCKIAFTGSYEQCCHFANGPEKRTNKIFCGICFAYVNCLCEDTDYCSEYPHE